MWGVGLVWSQEYFSWMEKGGVKNLSKRACIISWTLIYSDIEFSSKALKALNKMLSLPNFDESHFNLHLKDVIWRRLKILRIINPILLILFFLQSDKIRKVLYWNPPKARPTTVWWRTGQEPLVDSKSPKLYKMKWMARSSLTPSSLLRKASDHS